MACNTQEKTAGGRWGILNKGEHFVSIALLLHWVRTRPMEASGVHLGVQLTALRLSIGHHCFSKTIVTKALVLKLPVICPETSG